MNKKEYCFHCGYMSNGNIIDTKKKMPPKVLEIYFGSKYDKYIRNKNWLVPGILGPIYIFCQGYYLIGLLLIIIDSIISLFFMVFNHAFLFKFIVIVYNCTYWFINRVVWATIGNMIYLKLLIKRLSKMEKKNPTKFKEQLPILYKKDKRFIIIKYIIVSIIVFLLFNIIKTKIYVIGNLD
jgi:hypothetical protein